MIRANFTHAFPSADITAQVAALEAQAQPVVQALLAAQGVGAKPCLRAAFAQDDWAEIETHAARLRHNKHVVLMGTGGSSLGAKMLYEALAENGAHPTFHFIENTDAQTLENVWNAVDVERTGLLIISKSGNTVEALAPALWWLEHLTPAQQKQVAAHSAAIAVEGENPLRALAAHYGIPCLAHAADVEGRFSIFTLVGLLPAAVAGIDIHAIRRGAQQALQPASLAQTLKGAAWQVANMNAGKNMHSAWIYADRLYGLGQWFRQGWCESIGKDGKGSLVMEARGSVDQHSVLQLLLDGPADKIVTLIEQAPNPKESKVQAPAALQDILGFLHDTSLSEMLSAQAAMTLQLLQGAGVPVRTMQLAQADAAGVGQMVMSFMLEIVLAAELMQVNAFNQPAIEDSKRLIREYLKKHSSAA